MDSTLNPALINCELLCFLQNKSKSVPFDDLLKICCDFYTTDEIVNAQGVISKYAQHRLPVHRGSDKEKSKKTVTDILKCILDSQLSLPQFCSINMARLPPVTADHVDVAAMWLELSQLRTEVRGMAEIRQELRSMKAAIDELRLSSFPPLQTTTDAVVAVNQAAVNNVSATSAADVTRAAVQSGALRQQRPKRKTVVGSIKSQRPVQASYNSKARGIVHFETSSGYHRR